MAANFSPVSTSEDPEQQQEGMLDSGKSGIFADGNFSIEEAVAHEIGADINISGYHLNFFNCCCDFRRAVIILNVIDVIMLILTTFVLDLFFYAMEEAMDEDTENEDVEFEETAVLEISAIVFTVVGIISIGINCCGIYGAVYYKRWGIMTVLVFSVLQVFFQLYSAVSNGDGPSLVVGLGAIGIRIYAHYNMLKLMDAGLMTAQNYHRISSCCGDRRM